MFEGAHFRLPQPKERMGTQASRVGDWKTWAGAGSFLLVLGHKCGFEVGMGS